MMFKPNSLSTQVGAGLAAVVSVFVASLLLVAVLLGQLNQGVAHVGQQSLPMVVAVDRLDLSRSEVQQFLTDVSATHDPAAYAEAKQAVDHFHEAAKTVREILTQRQETDDLAQLAEISKRFDAFYASGLVMAAAYLKDGMETGNRLMKGSDGQPGFDRASSDVSDLLQTFRERQLARAQHDADDNLQATNRIRQVMLWGGLASTVMAGVIGWLIVRAIVSQLGGEPRAAVKLMQRVGTGDLSVRIRLRNGDTTSLMAHLQHMTAGLHQVVTTVRQQAQGVASASAQMAAGNQELADRTAAQALSLQQTAASVTQLSSTVEDGVAGARQASGLADAASGSATQSGALVGRFVDTMQGIEASSRQIGDIISLIDGIAFQTNILALNAAVEAARAGEQGRGFAVVASEVRSLAGRSAEAAKAISGLINASVTRVGEGAALVAQAQAAMAQVQQHIHSVSQSMGQVTAASAEQSAGIAVVAGAVGQIDQVTQRNAALVEQSAAAAAALRQQADALAEAVAVFKLGADAEQAVAAG